MLTVKLSISFHDFCTDCTDNMKNSKTCIKLNNNNMEKNACNNRVITNFLIGREVNKVATRLL